MVGMDRRGPRATGKTGTPVGFREAQRTHGLPPFPIPASTCGDEAQGQAEEGNRGRAGMREQGAAQSNLGKCACWRLGGKGRLARSFLTMAQGTGT